MIEVGGRADCVSVLIHLKSLPVFFPPSATHFSQHCFLRSTLFWVVKQTSGSKYQGSSSRVLPILDMDFQSVAISWSAPSVRLSEACRARYLATQLCSLRMSLSRFPKAIPADCGAERVLSTKRGLVPLPATSFSGRSMPCWNSHFQNW